MGDPLRVVLADDHPVVRDGLSALLASVDGIDVVATAAPAGTRSRRRSPRRRT